MKKTTPTLEVPSLKRMLAMVGEQVESLRPEMKPTRESIGACRAVATACNSYISGVRLALDAEKARGEKPDMKFLRLSDSPPEKIAAATLAA
jgi:hypothetical protein